MIEMRNTTALKLISNIMTFKQKKTSKNVRHIGDSMNVINS